MEPRITLITLGVDDLERAVAFYRDGLGLATKGIVGTQFSHGAVAFFDLQAGLKLALWPRESIAHDTGLARTGASPTDLTIAHNVRSKDEVDAVMAHAAQAGARIVKVPVPTFYAAMRATSRILTVICGKWHGIRIFRSEMNRPPRSSRRCPPRGLLLRTGGAGSAQGPWCDRFMPAGRAWRRWRTDLKPARGT